MVNQISGIEENETGEAGICNMITQEQYTQLLALLQQNSAMVNMVQARASSCTEANLPGFSGKCFFLIIYVLLNKRDWRRSPR